MWLLSLFGGVGIQDANGNHVALQRRPLALLAVLALAGERGTSRQRLAGLLWPDSDEERARNTLRQTLHLVRVGLGDPDPVMEVLALRLNPSAVRSDVGAFESLLRRDDVEGAVALYKGPVLDGFHIGGAAEFDKWADGQRASLGAQYGRALTRLATEASAGGDEFRAAHWWRVLANHDPLSAVAALGLMRALAASGDVSGALQHERVYATLVREELGALPDAATAEFAAKLREDRGHVDLGRPSRINSAPLAPQNTVMSDDQPEHGGASSESAARPACPKDASEVTNGRTALASLPLRRPNRLWVARGATALVVAAAIAVVGIIAYRMTVDTEKQAQVSPLAVLFRARHDTSRSIGGTQVAILPFAVAGADTSLSYLSEGMAYLLGTQLSGDVGPQASDAAAVLDALRNSAVTNGSKGNRANAVATAVGANEVINGSIVGIPDHLIISATLTSVPNGQRLATVRLQTSLRDLGSAVDQLALQLLAQATGEAGWRLASLARIAPNVLHAYIAGQVAYHRGQLALARDDFRQALEIDSTFALAALGLAESGGWIQIDDTVMTARWVALRSHLGVRDRALFDAYLGLGHPRPRTAEDEIEDWERAVHAAPARPEPWYELGDRLFHEGSRVDVPEYQEKAATDFDAALARDSAFVPALRHALELAVWGGDKRRVSAFAARYWPEDSTADAADFVRWEMAQASGDTTTQAELRRRFRVFSWSSLQRIIGFGQMMTAGAADLDSAAAAAKMRATTATVRDEVAFLLFHMAANRGRFQEAAVLSAQIRRAGPLSDELWWLAQDADQLDVLIGLFDGGPQAPAITAVTRLRKRSLARQSETAAGNRTRTDRCVVGLWDAVHSSRQPAQAVPSELDQSDLRAVDRRPGFGSADLCELIVRVAAGSTGEKRDKLREQLDSAMRTGPNTFGNDFGNIVLAHAFASSGDTGRALVAIRRRAFDWATGPNYLAEALRLEGELAANTSDWPAAASAFHRYLRLRDAPDPETTAEVDGVRRKLADVVERIGALKRQSGSPQGQLRKRTDD
jgi:DNA-binding SARP family transcriptional activator/TolB-like protein